MSFIVSLSLNLT